MLKIAFLFLTMTNIYHESYWRDFFRGHEQQYCVYVHVKNDMSPNSWFKQFQLPYKIENSWARTMKAQIGLLKEALKDPETCMFIFCSHNCIPLQSFDFIYEELIASQQSTFFYEPNQHADHNKNCYEKHRDLQPIQQELQYKNSQWIILNRKHAQMMVDDTHIINHISCYPHDQEHYPSTFLRLRNQLHEVHCCDKTLVVWHLGDYPPYIFKNAHHQQEWQLLIEAIKYGTFFVRKIDEHCDLSSLNERLSYKTTTHHR